MNTTQLASGLVTIGLCATLAGCGGASSSGPSAQGSTATGTTSASAGGSVESSAATATKTYTDASLVKLFTGRQLNGSTVTPSPMESMRTGSTTDSFRKPVEDGTSDPAECRSSMLAAWEEQTHDVADVRLDPADSSDPVVVVRAHKDAATARQVSANRTAGDRACSAATLRSPYEGKTVTITVRGTVTEAPGTVVTDLATDDYTSSNGERSTHTRTAHGSIGNVVVRATDTSGTASLESLRKLVEETAAIIAKDQQG